MRYVLLAGLRYLLRHPTLAVLSLLGVALGVAVVVAVDLANASATRAFHLTMEGVVGRATHQIVAGPGGIPDRLYRELAGRGLLPVATPVLEGTAGLPDGENVRLVGIDPISAAPFRPRLQAVSVNDLRAAVRLMTEPDGVLIDEQDAAALGARPGSRLRLTVSSGAVAVHVLATPAHGATPGVVITDIGTAQQLLHEPHRISEIDLIVPAGPAGRVVLARLSSALPPGVVIRAVGTRARTMHEATRAFRVNLGALSLLALLIGVFLIYNTMTFSVVRRRELFGILRGVGVSRAQLFLAVTLEALIIGAVATAVGIALGVGLAQHLVHLVTRTINDVYFAVQVRTLVPGPGPFAKGAALGLGATVLAALAPAVEAAYVRPRAAMLRSGLERRGRAFIPWLALAGIGAALAGGGLLLVPGGAVAPAYAALVCLVAAVALWIPGLTLIAVRGVTRLLPPSRAVVVRIALRGITAGLSRTSVAIAALAVALAATVAVGTMIGSVRHGVEQWLDQALQADIFVGPAGSRTEGRTLPPDLPARVERVPGVARVTRGRHVGVDTPFGVVPLVAYGMHRRDFGTFPLIAGRSGQAWRAFADAGRTPPAVLISESLARLHDLHPGDAIRLYTGRGLREFEIAGVFRYFGSTRGRIAISRQTYLRYWQDPRLSWIAVFLSPGASPPRVLRSIRRLLGPRIPFTARPTRSVREYTMAVFDQTFAVTAVLRLLTLIISIMGMISALMALELERARTFGVFRALGMTPRQTVAVVLGQTAFMGGLAGVLSLPAGLAFAALIVRVVNERVFGWLMPFRLDAGVVWQALAAAVAAALLAGVYPAWRLGRMRAARALREE
ncbi:MAG TPA: FtsX-like permease family protein [Gammaproteobacteria bacterium]|nr:FtsX-like permease family protein [Gammaproteobacteria bacterium]